MADSDSSNVDTSVDSRGSIDQIGQHSKLDFSEDEEKLVNVMYNLVGERWALIAGRIPGRTADEIEKYWSSKSSSSE
ncbi:hypothetical protein Scep_028722 [Stephania cephalantha]|uniref:Myb-like domain-containing protein n=1 Tax=Stephania cephalantha TaxID=152367 RepID=A0AAP0HNP6_9MAGN